MGRKIINSKWGWLKKKNEFRKACSGFHFREFYSNLIFRSVNIFRLKTILSRQKYLKNNFTILTVKIVIQ